jgi:major type 1 subunit fimbrin (pilin)
MKKSLIAATVLSVVLSSTAFAAPTNGDGKVNFTGAITDTTCVIDTNSLNQTVDLGKVSKASLPSAGSTSGAKKFTLVLSSCPATVTSAKVRFDGIQVPGDNSLLALTAGADTAKDVGIQISDANNNIINLYQDSAAYSLTTGVNNLNFTARYYAISDAVTVGDANAVTEFTIVY